MKYATWISQRLRRGNLRPIELQIGKPYAFGYKPGRGEGEKSEVDMAPVFIPLFFRSNGMRGVNLVALRDPALRRSFMQIYQKAIVAESEATMAKALYNLYRLITTDKRYFVANRMYIWKNIKTKIAELSAEDLDELSKRIL